MSDYKFETLQLHVGQEHPDPASDARAVPIYATTSYVFHNSQHAADRFGLADTGNIYGRLTNSTQGVFEQRISALEGGVAGLAVASGAAAITYTIQALAKQGEHIVAQKTIYGGTSNLLAHTLPLYGINSSFVDVHDLAAVEHAIQPNTKAIYIETLGNPNSDIPDIDAIADIAHKYGLPLVIDNTFGTPYLIRPIEHGADIVIHSQLPWRKVYRGCGKGRFCYLYPRNPAAGRGCLHQPLCGFSAASGYGNPESPAGTSCGERKESGEIPDFPSPGGKSQSSFSAGTSGSRAVRKVFSERRRFHFYIPNQGRTGGCLPVY